ncbi:MAG: tripartite tricarboxylate transporter substrate binding protein BugE [Betaproteobacteria bacterium]|jgi:tripartite-type tricarboxylate transporter receptor subunit TctC|nr:tripartite tricarboxylate transporter substrate binding protein BugE [Betaproteobacteria bacterium]
MIRRYCLMLVAAMAVSFASAVSAQSFPAKPIKLVVPFAPGGSTDLVARMLAERMGPLLGQTVTVDNRGGAGGTLGADLVAKATPDGYTLLMGTVSTHGASPAIYRKIPYDPVKDFQPITNVMSVPSVFVVNPKMPAKSMRDFIAMAKAAPGRHTFASPGIGSLGHANVENFAHLAGIQLLHVPYKGAGPALNDALAGQVDALTDNLPSALPHIQAGRLRALALLSPQRSSLLPDVPTYRELGFEELSEGGWFGLMAPAGTPPAVVARLREAAHRAMEDASFKAQAEKIGGVSMANTPDEFAQQIKQALARYQRVARVANIQPE